MYDLLKAYFGPTEWIEPATYYNSSSGGDSYVWERGGRKLYLYVFPSGPMEYVAEEGETPNERSKVGQLYLTHFFPRFRELWAWLKGEGDSLP